MRRVFIDQLQSGTLVLSSAESHHLRDVLRLGVGDVIRLFDSAGNEANGRIASVEREGLSIHVDEVAQPTPTTRRVCVASAVPKGERADWLVEKLSEIGVERWVPLRTARSVVHPEGTGKLERWRRHAIEAAKQSRRSGVMAIDELTTLDAFLVAGKKPLVILSTRPDAPSLTSAFVTMQGEVWLLVGPEGGWTEEETDRFIASGAIEASLTSTILRLETAAIVGAGIAITAPE